MPKNYSRRKFFQYMGGTALSLNAGSLLHAAPGESAVLPKSISASDNINIALIGAGIITGKRIVEMVRENLKPSDILTRNAFENCIAACSAIGGSTNAPVHINAIARHIGVKLDNDDWEKIGYELPLLVNLQPAGEYLAEEYYRAGGLPAVVAELVKKGKIKDAITVNGKTLAQNCEGRFASDRKVIFAYDKPMKKKAGFLNMKGNLFDSAIMKTSVITDEFRQRYLENPADPMAFEGTAVVFDGPEDYHARIDDPKTKITANSVLFIRGVGPVGYPGAAEVVNMQPPDALLKKGVTGLPVIGDGRQSGTADSPSILHASPEAAIGGGLGWLRTGDVIRVDLNKHTCDVLLPAEEIAKRKAEFVPSYPESQTPWQELYRAHVGGLDGGGVLEFAVKYRGVAKTTPRHNH